MVLRKESPCGHRTLTSIDSADSVISGSEPITCRVPGFHTLLTPLVSGIPELSCLLVLGSFSELSGVGGHFKGLRTLVGKRVPETSQSCSRRRDRESRRDDVSEPWTISQALGSSVGGTLLADAGILRHGMGTLKLFCPCSRNSRADCTAWCHSDWTLYPFSPFAK